MWGIRDLFKCLVGNKKYWASRVEGGRGEAYFWLAIGFHEVFFSSSTPRARPTVPFSSIRSRIPHTPSRRLGEALSAGSRGDGILQGARGNPSSGARGEPAGPGLPGRRGSLLWAALIPGASQAGGQARAIRGAAGLVRGHPTTSPPARSRRRRRRHRSTDTPSPRAPRAAPAPRPPAGGYEWAQRKHRPPRT